MSVGLTSVGSSAVASVSNPIKQIYFGTNPVPIETLKLGNTEIKEVWVGVIKVFSI